MQNIDYDLEYDNAIKKMALGGETSALFKIDTPTGAPSKLTYIQQLLVRTKSFKEWFGDWEDFANKIVQSRKDKSPFYEVEIMIKKNFDKDDKSNGNLSKNQKLLWIYFENFDIKNLSYTIDYDTLEPQAYWHGTKSEEFFEFKTYVSRFGRPYAYFAVNKSYSDFFSASEEHLYSVFTCIKNPYINFNYEHQNTLSFISEIFIDYGLKNNLDSAQIEKLAKDKEYDYIKKYGISFSQSKDYPFWRLMSDDSMGQFKMFLQSLGYDGVMYVEELRLDSDISKEDEFTRAVTIFEPNQVKLADGRNTEFSSLSNDIRYEKGGLIAPNGKKSNLTPEQYKLVRTPEFKKWFGDWENDPKNASQVVDENGEPLVVYHGTYAKEPFYTFDLEKADLGFHFGTKEQAKNRSTTKFFIEGFKSYVSSYFLNIKPLFEVSDIGEWEYPQRYIDMLISDNIIDEKIAKEKGFLSAYYREDNVKIREYIKSKYGNFVGFIYNNKYEGDGKSFIVLSPNQIKLADETNTTFDNESNDIRYKEGGNIDNKIAFITKFENNIYWLISKKDDDFYYQIDGDRRLYVVKDMAKRWGYKLVSAKEYNDYYDVPERIRMHENKTKYENGGKTTTMNRYSHLHGMFGQETPKFAEGGSVATAHGITNNGKKGGYFDGRSHAEGGIKAWNSTTNSPIEVEGGEVIITKKAVEDDELYEFEGEMLTNRQILSKINESGGGVKFEDGGEIHQCNCSGKMYKFGGETMEDYQIMNKINSTYNKKQGMKNHKTSYGHNLMRKMKEGGYC
jgi:hypothetical protein